VAGTLLGQPPAGADVPDFDAEGLARWDELCGRARTQSVGFVMLSTQVHSLLEDQHMHGFNLAGFLAEAGFRQKVIYFDPPEVRQHSKRVDPLTFHARLCALTGGAPVEMEVIGRRSDLPRALVGGGLDLVYSEIRNDPRLQAAGIAQFNMEDLEVGFQGTLATLDRLVRRAGVPFRRKWRGYLANVGEP